MSWIHHQLSLLLHHQQAVAFNTRKAHDNPTLLLWTPIMFPPFQNTFSGFTPCRNVLIWGLNQIIKEMQVCVRVLLCFMHEFYTWVLHYVKTWVRAHWWKDTIISLTIAFQINQIYMDKDGMFKTRRQPKQVLRAITRKWLIIRMMVISYLILFSAYLLLPHMIAGCTKGVTLLLVLVSSSYFTPSSPQSSYNSMYNHTIYIYTNIVVYTRYVHGCRTKPQHIIHLEGVVVIPQRTHFNSGHTIILHYHPLYA